MVKNNVDCLVWIKLEKNFFSIEEDIYIGITYIAPENSPIHDIYSVDIFKTIQDDTSFFLRHGKVFLLGDLNSRTSTKTDFIEHDRPIKHEYHIEADAPIPRFSLDNGTNRFGDLLLDLCKSSSLRIVNGRLFNDKTVGKMTCYTHNGESVVDYLLTSFSNFSTINDFEIQNFNEYSNHAPLYFGLKVYTNRAEELQQERTYYKWNDDLKGTFLNDMTRDVHHLNRFISDGISKNCDPDDIITVFSQFIADRANPHFEKHSKQTKHHYFTHTNTTEKQQWYNDECKRKRTVYNNALFNFNLTKNNKTRKLMLDAKKDYKYYCRSCKSKHSYDQGRKMNDMRKKHPREFWKMFKNKKSTSSETGISIEQFYQYFESLSTEENAFQNPEVNEFLQNFETSRSESTFHELDDPITQEEIKRAPHSLNRINLAPSIIL